MKPDLDKYTRVTDVLYPFSSLHTVPPMVLQKAADRGTLVHSLCNCTLHDIGVPNISEEVEGYYNSFLLWKADKKFLSTPERFFCETHRLTGECDALFEIEGKKLIIDFKTSARENPLGWQLQGSAYCYLARLAGLQIDGMLFVKLNKLGESASEHTYEEDFTLFCDVLRIYRIFFENTKKIDTEDL